MSEKNNKDKNPWMKLFGVVMDKHELLRQFVCTLEAELGGMEHEYREKPDRMLQIEKIKEEIKRVRENFGNTEAWSTAYKIEKQLIEFYNDDRATLEFSRRVEEAKRLEVPFKDYYVSLLEGPPSNDSVKNALLLLVTDLQWFYNRRYVRQRYAKYTFQRVALMFLVSFAIFVLTIYLFAGKFDLQNIVSKPSGGL